MDTKDKLIEKMEELIAMNTKDKYIQKLEEYIESILKYKFVIPMDMYNKFKSEIAALKAEMEKEDTDELKDELLKFKKWYDSLSPASKCTVHPPAGSGGSYGIYNLTDAGLINNYLRKIQ